MKVLILGVNGFVGAAVAVAATSIGLDVFGLSRSQRPQAEFAGGYVVGDRNNPAAVRQVVVTHRIDVVVDVLPLFWRGGVGEYATTAARAG